MLARLICLLTLVGLVAAPSPARAAEPTTKTPTVLVRLRSLDGVLEDMKYFLSLTGQKDAVKQLDDGLAKLPPHGIDTKKPWALYGVLDNNFMESGVVLQIPIKDEKAFLGLLEKVANLAPKKDGDYYVLEQVGPLPFPIYFKFADGYLLATIRDKTALEKDKLLTPATLFAKPQTSTALVEFHVDQIPDVFKQVAIGQLELQLSKVDDDKLPGETAAQHALKVEIAKEAGKHIGTLINETTEIALDFDLSKKRDAMEVKLGVKGKPGSSLEQAFKGIAKSTSIFSNLAGKDSAFTLAMHAALPESLLKPLGPVIDEALQQGLAKAKDDKERARNEKLVKALAPTLKAGVFDAAISFQQASGGKYTLVMGLKVQDGDKILAAVKEGLTSMPEAARAKIKMDAGMVGDAKLIEIDVQGDMDENARRLFGANPAFAAIRRDCVLFGAGEKARDAMAGAIQASPGPAAPVRLQIDVSQMAPLMKDNQPRAEKFAKESFVKTGDGQVVFGLEGGDSLQLKLHATGPVLKFFAALGAGGEVKK